MSAIPEHPIYVVDDDVPVLLSLCFLLQGEGHRVESFSDGHSVLAAFPGPEPRFLVLDYVMPDIDGIELFRELRARDVRAPAVLMTGDPGQAVRQRARIAGLAVIEKPLAYEPLLAMLAEVDSAPRHSAI
ncbi:MAG: response regulator [Methylobacterium sp.]|uniref:response regulator transcription factor n=1 Tax=Methylobacterium sp. TaxID=409 RepID=UPI0025EDFE93|nr:response regulator [Methylobacterium sp.]MBX9930659.1 response regulator [Methylobacterium sp.]